MLIFKRRPVPKQSARFVPLPNGKIKSFLQDDVVAFERGILIEALSQRPKGFIKFSGPLRAEATFQFKMLESFTAAQKASIRSGKNIWKITKPDLTDNLGKGLFDALKEHFFSGDETICSYECKKIYGLEDKIILKLIPLS